MSLNFDISNIDRVDELKTFGTFDQHGDFEPDPNGKNWQLKSLLECLIWASMLTGCNKITKDNWPEVYLRTAMVETVIGAYRRTSEGDMVYFTPDDIKRCIGLKTNATALSKGKFDNYVANMVRRPCEHALRQYEAAQQEVLENEVQNAIQTETEAPAAM